MKCCRTASWMLALSIAALLMFVGLQPRQGAGHEEDEKETEPGAALELPERPIELLIELGREDEEQVRWQGELKLSEGKMLSVELVQASIDSTLDGAKFDVRTARRQGVKPTPGANQNRRANQRRARQQNRAARQQANQKQPEQAKKETPDQKKPADAADKKDRPNPPDAAQPAPKFHLVPVRMRVTLDAPVSAKLEVASNRGS